jgi:hypothetical protein
MHLNPRWRQAPLRDYKALASRALHVVLAGCWATGADTAITWTAASRRTWTEPTNWSSNPSFPNNGIPAGTDMSSLDPNEHPLRARASC